MADNYFRLVCFVVNICPEPLREFFIQLAKKDAGPSYTTLDAYLTRRKADISQLKGKKVIRNDQLDVLFPNSGTANESQWDVTLLVTLITNLFPTQMQPLETFVMREIREIRNMLQHISNTANVSNHDFSTHWGRLEFAAMSLALKVFSTADQISLKTKIDEMKKNRLPDLVECLRLWHEETVKQMANKIEELSNTVTDLKKKLDDVESNTSKTASILQQVTVQKPGPNGDGDKNKRFKSVDNILKQLQACFESTIKELPDNFDAPAEVADIRTALRDNHHVIVTGSYKSRYFETALAAVTGMDFNYKRCVEMQKSSDWRHIDPDDVDFVLCRDPFGSISYDENKARSMDDIFKSMMHTAQEVNGKRIDIMIVTDFMILTECKQLHDHDILGQVVKVFDATTADQPADLTSVSVCDRVPNVYSSSSQMTNNLRVLTDNFLRQYSITSGQVDAATLRPARDKFKANKAIIISGPKNSGKTSAAVALSSSYQPSQCLLLTEPNDIKSISFQNTCLVIIDEFAGRYRYEKNEVYKWYSMFDHLYSAVTAGQLNVVVTCEKSKLDRCLAEISPHPLLEHRVDLPDRIMVIKQEPREVEDDSDRSIRQQQIPASLQRYASKTTLKSGSAEMHITPFEHHDQNPDKFYNSRDTASHSNVFRRHIHINEMIPLDLRLIRTPEVPGNQRQQIQGSGSLLFPSQAHDYADTIRQTINSVGIKKLKCLCDLDEESLLNHCKERTCRVSAVSGTGNVASTEVQSISHVNESIAKSAKRSTGPHVWTVQNTAVVYIKVKEDNYTCGIYGCCKLPTGQILLADFVHKRLKKLDYRYKVIAVCDLPHCPSDVCCIGKNEVVVSLNNKKLQFVDVASMTLTRSVNIEHDYECLTCHGDRLYVADCNSIYLYNTDGIKQQVLYTGTLIHFIAVNDEGSKIYITDSNKLITIDSSGNHLYTFTDPELSEAFGVCVDGEGHVLVCDEFSRSILQFSSDGKRKLGTIANRNDIIKNPRVICFDRHKSTLICAGNSSNVTVLQLK